MTYVKRLETFFLEAAAQTYAGGGERTTLPGLPHSKVYTFGRDDLLYRDVYFTNRGGSVGLTMIWDHEQPVWSMHYSGQCVFHDPEVTAFLKEALGHLYASGIFFGGRGPAEYPGESHHPRGTLIYENAAEGAGRFDRFCGKEKIYRSPRGGDTLLHHEYRGGLLAVRLTDPV